MRWLVERPGLALSTGLLITVAALFPASRLGIDVDPSTLLPSGSQAATDYEVFLDRFGGLERVFVLLLQDGDGDAKGDLIAAADRLADRLAGSAEIASARSGLSENDLEFLRRYVAPRAPLLLGDDWRRRVEERITAEALERRALAIRHGVESPIALSDAGLLASDPLGLTQELPALRGGASGLPIDLLTGAFLAPDGRAALVVVQPRHPELDPAGGRRLAHELEHAFQEVGGGAETPIRFLAVGGPLYAAEDESLIRSEVRGSLSVSAAGCLLLLILAFGSVSLPALTFVAVMVGLVWTAGGLALTAGAVTAVGLGFSAVLIGLGIDYGIHGSARFLQRRLDGEAPQEALAETLRASGPGILTSALTTAGAFAVLALAHFRPLRELGLLVGVGILCILLSSLWIGAPLALLLGSRTPPRTGRLWRWLGSAVEWTSRRAQARGRPILVGVGIVTALSAWGLTRLSLDPALTVFRSTRHSAHEAEQVLAERFGVGLETVTVVLTGADLQTALSRAAEVERRILETSPEGVRVTSPASWLTAGSTERRLAELANLPLLEAADALEVELASAGLDPAFFQPGLLALRELGHGRDPAPPTPDTWPDWLDQLIRVGPQGAFAALRIRAPKSAWPDGPPGELVQRIRSEVGGHVASASLVGVEIRQLAAADLRDLGLLAFVVVAAILLISFRGSLSSSSLAVLPVLLGAVWSLGLWGALGRPLDLVTLAVLPIILGIGLDDGLHVLHAFRRDPHRDMVAAVAGVGRAMILTTATTCIAFGSLAGTSVPGLRNAGLLVTAGVLGCLAATGVVLPALTTGAGGRDV